MNKSLGSKARLLGRQRPQPNSVKEERSWGQGILSASHERSILTCLPRPLSSIPTKRTRQGPSLSCTALESESSSTGFGCHGNSLQSSSLSTSTRPCRVITSPCGSSTMSVGMPARETQHLAGHCPETGERLSSRSGTVTFSQLGSRPGLSGKPWAKTQLLTSYRTALGLCGVTSRKAEGVCALDFSGVIQ